MSLQAQITASPDKHLDKSLDKQESRSSESLQYICKLKGQVRLLHTRALKKSSSDAIASVPGSSTQQVLPPICAAIYVKEGKEQTVGQASQWSLCAQFLINIKKNLEAASWSCRSIKSVGETQI